MKTPTRYKNGRLLALLCGVMLLCLLPTLAMAATFHQVTSMDDLNASAHYIITKSNGSNLAALSATTPDSYKYDIPYSGSGDLEVAISDDYAFNLTFAASSGKVKLGTSTKGLKISSSDGLFVDGGVGKGAELTLTYSAGNGWTIYGGSRYVNYSNGTFSVGKEDNHYFQIWTDYEAPKPTTETYTLIDIGNLANFDDTTEFVMVFPIKDANGKDTGERYAVGSTSGGDGPVSWLYKVTKSSNDTIEVDTTWPVVLHAASNSSGVYFEAGTVHGTYRMQASSGIQQGSSYFRPLNLPNTLFGRSSNNSMQFQYGMDADGNVVTYVRGNGDSCYVAYNYNGGNVAFNYVGYNSALDVTANALNNKWQPVEIYAKVQGLDEVRYHKTDGSVLQTAYLGAGDSLALKPTMPDEPHNGVTYRFVGWSTEPGHTWLSLEESANLYDYDLGDQFPGVDNVVKKDIREKLKLVGPCSPSALYVAGRDEFGHDLYPVYQVKGYDKPVAANEKDAPADHVQISNYDILTISRHATDEDLKKEDADTTYCWLGSINVEVYLDGQIWVSSKPMYFKYHNDDSVDINIKFVDPTLAKQIGQPTYEEELKAFSLLTERSTFPTIDPTNQFIIDSVYVSQGRGEKSETKEGDVTTVTKDGIMYEWNWLTNHGGQLDNVEGGSTVKVYVTSKYQVKYFLNDEHITGSAWTDDELYTTKETEEKFRTDSANNKYYVTSDNQYSDLMDESVTEGYFLSDTMERGYYEDFAYFIKKYPHIIDVSESPESLVIAPDVLTSTSWELKTKQATVDNIKWNDEYPVTASNKKYAYKISGLDEVPTFHLYAYTKPPVPQTGDDSHLLLWGILMAMSLLGLTRAYRLRRNAQNG